MGSQVGGATVGHGMIPGGGMGGSGGCIHSMQSMQSVHSMHIHCKPLELLGIKMYPMYCAPCRIMVWLLRNQNGMAMGGMAQFGQGFAQRDYVVGSPSEWARNFGRSKMLVFQWAKHKELWDELAQTGGKCKNAAKALKGVNVLCECWCCEAVKVEDEYKDGELAYYVTCEHCPLAWPGGRCATTDGSGLYGRWCRAQDMEERKRLAAQIRDLPLASGWKADKNGLTATFS